MFGTHLAELSIHIADGQGAEIRLVAEHWLTRLDADEIINGAAGASIPG
jgi:hypothetical protein